MGVCDECYPPPPYALRWDYPLKKAEYVRSILVVQDSYFQHKTKARTVVITIRAAPPKVSGSKNQNDDTTDTIELETGNISQPMQTVSKASEPSVRSSSLFSEVSASFSPRLSLPPL